MSDQNFKQIARDVRTIKKMQLYPAAAGLGCVGLIVGGLVSLIVLVGLLGVIGRLFGL